MPSLRQLLHSHAVLGPAVPGRDPLLYVVNSFVDTLGSPGHTLYLCDKVAV